MRVHKRRYRKKDAREEKRNIYKGNEGEIYLERHCRVISKQ